MRLSELAPSPGSRVKRKRVGRGTGSGHGKTSCRGHKGQKSRSGGGPGFEGGQMPLQRRVPKRGFTNIFQKNIVIVNVGVLEKLEETMITPDMLVSEGIIKDIKDGVKILGNGDITRAITVKAHAFSASAKEKIEKAKGTIELL
jgi:large subunit ribosomal protein L15